MYQLSAFSYQLVEKVIIREKDSSRKDAKGAKFGDNRQLFFFASLASWREILSALVCG